MSQSERGDTIIEVIFAVAIFAFVAVSSLAIMHQGVTAAEKALEVTLVRQQMNAQAEALRYIHDVKLASRDAGSPSVWSTIVSSYAQANASPYGAADGTCKLPSGSFRPFILNARKGEVWSSPPTITQTGRADLPPYPQVVYNTDSSISKAYGLWVEAVPSPTPRAEDDKTPQFVDFHIRACWDGPGSAIPMTLGTIVRLYDPR